jgi:hypothetical protein
MAANRMSGAAVAVVVAGALGACGLGGRAAPIAAPPPPQQASAESLSSRAHAPRAVPLVSAQASPVSASAERQLKLYAQLRGLAGRQPTVFSDPWFSANGKLRIGATDVQRGQRALKAVYPRGVRVTVVKVAYSNADLKSVDARLEKAQRAGELPFAITGAGFLPERNRVVVFLAKDDLSARQALYRVGGRAIVAAIVGYMYPLIGSAK